MAEIGGMLAAGAIKLAAGKVAEAAGARFMLQWRFSDDLEAMKTTTEFIEAVLKDAERLSLTDNTVQVWLQHLTQASYDISDMFDEFELNATKKSSLRKLKLLNPCLALASEVPMATKMSKVRKRLENIANQRRNYNFTTSSSSNDQQIINDRATSSKLIKTEILGRDQEIQKILRTVSTSSDFIIVPICGIGGIGKTTLAQLLFNDTHFKDYKKAWVYVSKTFDLNKIKEKVTTPLQLEQDQLVNTQEEDPGPSARKSILIVLDDLWEEDDTKLYNLERTLKIIGEGYKVCIIVTTRDAHIARKIQTVEAHRLNPLSWEVCWTIIKQMVGFEERSDKERLKEIGKEIARKCGGVALAARTIGFTLRSRDMDGWFSVKESSIWNVCMVGTSSPYHTVLASLKLSYSSMPPYLRLCFAYCAIFPKGHNMSKDDLIYQWAALGFIKLQHGHICVKQLLDMSFLEPSKFCRFHTREDVTLFTMHDLVHDLARSVMGDELHDASEQIEGRNCRYASLADCSKPLNSYIKYPDKIKSLHFLSSGESELRSSNGFSCAKYLRVLDLGESYVQKLPSSIGQLKLLRYLNASRITDRVIPDCITKLSKLIYLSLHGSDIETLPESFGEMESLIYLNLSGCSSIKKLPDSFGKLSSLVHLDLSNCKELDGVPGALCNLNKLQYLDLTRTSPQGLLEAMAELIELRYLSLQASEGYVDPASGTIIGILDRIRTLPNLEHLNLSSNFCIEVIPDSICSLRKLHTLDLSYCSNIKELPGNMADMKSLKFLIKDCCFALDKSTLPINKNLIHLPTFVVHAIEGGQSSNLIMLKDVNPREFKIRRLENVKCLQEAQKIELEKKQNMKRLTLHWTRKLKGSVVDMEELLRELRPPSSLETFKLQGYSSVSFPEWLTGISIYLPNLTIVTLRGLSRCSSLLPPLGQLANLQYLSLEDMPSITKIDRGFWGDNMKAYPVLDSLIISDMENLEEWRAAPFCGDCIADEFMFRLLKSLTINKCRKLRVGPCPPRVETLKIEDSDGVVLQSAEGAPNTACSTSSAPPVRTLHIESCMVPMHQWKVLHHLPSLNVLYIRKCNDLISSAEVTQALTPLQKLHLVGASQELPQWLGDLTCLRSLTLVNCQDIQALPERLCGLVSLKKLNIGRCKGITPFMESIKQFTNLEKLSIWVCPELSKWWELEENKTEVDYIKEKYVFVQDEPNHMELRYRGQ